MKSDKHAEHFEPSIHFCFGIEFSLFEKKGISIDKAIQGLNARQAQKVAQRVHEKLQTYFGMPPETFGATAFGCLLDAKSLEFHDFHSDLGESLIELAEQNNAAPGKLVGLSSSDEQVLEHFLVPSEGVELSEAHPVLPLLLPVVVTIPASLEEQFEEMLDELYNEMPLEVESLSVELAKMLKFDVSQMSISNLHGLDDDLPSEVLARADISARGLYLSEKINKGINFYTSVQGVTLLSQDGLAYVGFAHPGSFRAQNPYIPLPDVCDLFLDQYVYMRELCDVLEHHGVELRVFKQNSLHFDFSQIAKETADVPCSVGMLTELRHQEPNMPPPEHLAKVAITLHYINDETLFVGASVAVLDDCDKIVLWQNMFAFSDNGALALEKSLQELTDHWEDDGLFVDVHRVDAFLGPSGGELGVACSPPEPFVSQYLRKTEEAEKSYLH